MREFMEIEFSTRHLTFFIIILLICFIALFFFGFYQGRKYEKMQARETSTLQENQVVADAASLKEREDSQDSSQEEAIQKEKVVEEKPGEFRTAEKLEPETEKEVSAPAENGMKYFVQVGAFRNQEYALSTQRRFEERGYRASLFEPVIDFLFYRVVVGGYRSEAEAVRVKQELEQSDRAKYYIIQSEKK